MCVYFMYQNIGESEFKTFSKEHVKYEAKQGVNGMLQRYRRFLETFGKIK